MGKHLAHNPFRELLADEGIDTGWDNPAKPRVRVSPDERLEFDKWFGEWSNRAGYKEGYGNGEGTETR